MTRGTRSRAVSWVVLCQYNVNNVHYLYNIFPSLAHDVKAPWISRSSSPISLTPLCKSGVAKVTC